MKPRQRGHGFDKKLRLAANAVKKALQDARRTRRQNKAVGQKYELRVGEGFLWGPREAPALNRPKTKERRFPRARSDTQLIEVPPPLPVGKYLERELANGKRSHMSRNQGFICSDKTKMMG